MNEQTQVPMSAFGFAGATVSTPGYVEGNDFVPPLDESYVFEKKSLMLLRAWWITPTREPLYITGPQGCGKTSIVEQFAARLNIPVISIMGRDPMEKSDLMGTPWIGENGVMRFVHGPVPLAYGADDLTNGCLLLVNEFSAAPPGFWVANNEVLEGKPVYIEQLGRYVHPRPGFRLVVTDNTRGLVGDDSGMLQGRFRQDASVMDRFWSLEMSYMEREAEIALLRKGLTMFPSEFADRFANTLRDVAEHVRDAYLQVNASNDAIETSLSTRTLLRIQQLILMFRDGVKQGINPLEMAFSVGLTNKCGPSTRQTIHKIVSLKFGDLLRADPTTPAQNA
jgi:cobaltochelatase CobS